MTDPTFNCPSCGEKIKLTDSLAESLAGPMIASTRLEFEEKLKQKDASIIEQNNKLHQEQKKLASQREALQEELDSKLSVERKKIIEQEHFKAKKLSALELETQAQKLTDLALVVTNTEKKLAQSQGEQAVMMKHQRQLEEEKRSMEITIEKRVAKEAELIRLKAKSDAENEMDLKVKEKEMTISAMQKQIQDLKNRAEQGSQQAQGEVLEIELEALLKEKFVFDTIEPVAKGEQGGDIIQTVMSPNGTFCGRILWETKRTKNWSGSWIAKLKDDQRRAQADIAILMTSALPSEVKRFGQLHNVWVTDFESALSLIHALRLTLIQVASTKAAQNGQESKMELIYDYLTGPKFRHRIEAIVEKFDIMREDLTRERKVMTKNWAKREAQIQGVIDTTMGMYGDLEGIAGQEMPEIEGLDIPLLEEKI